MCFRPRSNSSRKEGLESSQLIEVDLEGGDAEVEILGFKKLEDAIHGIIVRRSAPSWLPFLPGSSYWVPPRKKQLSVVELVGRLANPMTEEETMSFTTARGWPSSSYFIEDSSPHPVEGNSKKTPHSEEEEG
ncbi:hypothetical protein AMTR_s00025p00162300 [Amborella trichopoda]|uniref:Uncharacterized protein n=2 Tax=Amborella trichopoda TaxID=13333 RepID=W1PX98_AMBTC|nr:hypothetical protein AMTR_s00025p00162300 [Amborella trichopoda]